MTDENPSFPDITLAQVEGVIAGTLIGAIASQAQLIPVILSQSCHTAIIFERNGVTGTRAFNDPLLTTHIGCVQCLPEIRVRSGAGDGPGRT